MFDFLLWSKTICICRHNVVRCIHGDEIIAVGYRRSQCLLCGKYLKDLPDICCHKGKENIGVCKNSMAITAEEISELYESIKNDTWDIESMCRAIGMLPRLMAELGEAAGERDELAKQVEIDQVKLDDYSCIVNDFVRKIFYMQTERDDLLDIIDHVRSLALDAKDNYDCCGVFSLAQAVLKIVGSTD